MLFVVDPLVLRPNVTVCAQLREAGYTVHEVKRKWSAMTALTRNCCFLATLIAENLPNAPSHTLAVPHEAELYQAKDWIYIGGLGAQHEGAAGDYGMARELLDDCQGEDHCEARSGEGAETTNNCKVPN